MLNYGAEIWGLHADLALKIFLSVSIRTPSDMVYGETGRHPLYVNMYMKSIKFWLRIIKMPPERLPNKAYKMLLHMHGQNRNSWASSVCFLLHKYGFDDVWVNQGVGDESVFLKFLKERLCTSYCQEWSLRIHAGTNERYSLFATFKNQLKLSSFLTEIKNIQARALISRIRLGVSRLNTHRNRFVKNGTVDDFACPACGYEVESEIHFILVCPAYDDIRNQFIAQKYFNCPSQFKLTMLLASESKSVMSGLGHFLVKAFDARSYTLCDQCCVYDAAFAINVVLMCIPGGSPLIWADGLFNKHIELNCVQV